MDVLAWDLKSRDMRIFSPLPGEIRTSNHLVRSSVL